MITHEVRFCRKCGYNVEFIVVLNKLGKTESFGCTVCMAKLVETMKGEYYAAPQMQSQPSPQKTHKKVLSAKSRDAS